MNNQQPHPVTITCPHCKKNPRREGQTTIALLYSCECGATQRSWPKAFVRQRALRGYGHQPPNDAA